MATKKAKVGESVEVAEGGTVTRPDGTAQTVTGGVYVLDAEGRFEVEGSPVEVTA